MKKSPKQSALEKKILRMVAGKARDIVKHLFKNRDIETVQNYANTVSIKRLGYNDHGPVHIRIAMLNAIRIFDLLDKAGVEPNLVAEEIGSGEDALIAILIALFFHDFGMSVTRQNHELMSAVLAQNLIMETLAEFYDDPGYRLILRSVVTEGIIGHMGNHVIHSLEAGIVLIADGCDMTSGRARIPTMLTKIPQMGDIHRYSASSIAGVRIVKGQQKPVRITIAMHNPAGFFQVEEVLLPKINASPIKPLVEVVTKCGDEKLQYL